jgi:hypothetical protein
MARLKRFELRVSVRMVAGLLSVMLHLGLFLVVLASGGRQDGVDDDDTPIARVVILESPKADPRNGVESRPLALAVPATNLRLRLNLQAIPPPSPFLLDREPDPGPDADRDSDDADDVDGPSPRSGRYQRNRSGQGHPFRTDPRHAAGPGVRAPAANRAPRRKDAEE